MKTTLKYIARGLDSHEILGKTLSAFGKESPDEEPVAVLDLVEILGLELTLDLIDRRGFQYERELRQFAVYCADSVSHLLTDTRSISGLKVAQLFLNGLATDDEMRRAHSHARSVVHDADNAGTVDYDYSGKVFSVNDYTYDMPEHEKCASAAVHMATCMDDSYLWSCRDAAWCAARYGAEAVVWAEIVNSCPVKIDSLDDTWSAIDSILDVDGTYKREAEERQAKIELMVETYEIFFMLFCAEIEQEEEECT